VSYPPYSPPPGQYPQGDGYPPPDGYPVSGGYPDSGSYQQPGAYPPPDSYQQPGYQQPAYQQPSYPQPGGYQPYGPPLVVPVAPVLVGAPAPAPPGKSNAPTVLLIVGICVFVFLALCGFGIWRFYLSAKDVGTHTTSGKYSVGDCLDGQSEATITEVSCSGPHDWEVVGVIPSVYESEATAEGCAALWSDSEAVYWYGTVGARGTSYCLAPAA